MYHCSFADPSGAAFDAATHLRQMKRPSPPSSAFLGILACFFLSGAAGLVYQVAWSKALGLIFGHTVYAISTVLAVFMAGITAGSAFLGRWSERYGDPVSLYARLEFLIGATGALSLAGLAGVRWLYVFLYPAVGGMQPVILGVRFVGACAVLFIPTFLMGGTFPVLVRAIAGHSAELGRHVSLLYWVNTLGAVAGTLASGFILLPALGLRETIAAAAGLNVVAALVALAIAHTAALTREAKPVVPERKLSPAIDQQRGGATFLLVVFAVVGGTAFAYEIGWTRLLAVTISSSTYAFTLMLAAFLAGTVIGSVCFQHFSARGTGASLATFSWTQICTGAVALASLILFRWSPSLVPLVLRTTHETFGGLVLAQCVTSVLSVLPVAIVFGFNFPVVVVLIERATGAGWGRSAIVGKAYAANTLGAIFGALIAGFWLVPWLGSFRVVTAAAGLNLLLALALEMRAPQRASVRMAMTVVCLGAAVALGSSSWFYNKSLLSLSAALYGNSFQGRLSLSEIAATNDLVFMEDGINDSIAVFRSGNYVALRVNGKTDASTGDTRTQLLLAHLGAAFHPAPKRVLVIGFGSGMTVAALARYPDVERIDCVEIEPAVIHAAPYLESLNHGALSDPRLHIIFDDARSFLLASPEKYDLIISEPSNPWIAGIATLFTTEYYRAVRERLAPGGIFVQWLQAYSLAPEDLRMVVATLAPHFPEVTLWHGAGPDLLLLCRTNASALRFQRLRSLWQDHDLRSDFETLDAHDPEGILAYFLLDDGAVRKLAEYGALNTDDRTRLEYDAPRTMLKPELFDQNQELIAGLRTSLLPSKLALGELPRALESAAETALDLKDAVNARRFLDALESKPETANRYLLEGRFALLQGNLKAAQSNFEAALKDQPDSPQAMHWLATAQERDGKENSARLLVDRILKSHPRFLPALTDEMQFAANRKDFGIAMLAQLNRMAAMENPPASEYCRLGAIWIKMANFAEAEPVLLRGIAKDPYSYACHLELGELYREARQFSLAREHFEFVERFYPDYDATLYRSLAGIDVALGDAPAAARALRKGIRVFPHDPDLRKAVSAANFGMLPP